MYKPSPYIIPVPPMVSPMSPFSIGTELAGLSVGAPGSSAWQTAKRCVYVPFVLPLPTKAVKMWCVNGATVAGTNKVDLGLYSSSGLLPASRLVSVGTATNLSGTNAIQVFDTTDLALQPNTLYFMAMSLDNTSDTIFRMNFSLTSYLRALGVYQETTGAFGLPTTATPVVAAANYLPIFGFSTVTLI